ncbi:MAG: Hpt domain-containing protein, partial [Gammaproteobacteria bacterium]
MREAIDYNALSWIRQEVGITLKQSRLELEEYAEGEQRKELLQGCAAHLHEARGPLQMVNIKGADMLACEMEEAIADLLLETVVDKETLLEQLMQGFLELPEYLSNLRSGRKDNPRQLFPLINSLRASRGLQPLNEDAVFAPDLSASMPAPEFSERAKRGQRDMTTLARAARVRFQSGLLEWYRDSGTNHGLQTLVDVLEHLQGTAGSEHAARIWWVGAGVAELLRDGAIETNPTVKRLFGQLDRQIKRLMDSGEAVFDDVLSEDLLKNLLFQLTGFDTDSPRITSIRSTYGITAHNTVTTDATADANDLGDELLQTVSLTARDEVERIKDLLDSMNRKSEGGMAALVTVADGLHSLGNTLGMIGMEKLGARLAEKEVQLRELAAADAGHGDMEFNELANTLVAVEDALSDIAAHSGNGDVNADHGNAVLRQGQQAVVNAVIADIAAAKEAINDFLNSSDDFGLLDPVPVLLNKICGGLELVDEERLAVASRQVRNFIAMELLKNHRQLNEDELDSLADAICSIEYCVEELGENHRYGERAIGVAVASLEKLGYADAGLHVSGLNAAPVAEPASGELAATVPQAAVEPEHHAEPVIAEVQLPELPSGQTLAGEIHETGESQMAVPRVAAEPEQASTGPTAMDSEAVAEPVAAEVQQVATPSDQAAVDETPAKAELQVISPDADSEIVEIFIEEAGEVLDGLAVDIPAWIADPDDREVLAEIRRAFHTIKGSGRMVGAMAAGELAWAFENLVNRVIENTVPACPAVLELVGQAMPALRDLVAQVSNPDTILLTDVSVLGSRAVHLSKPGAHYDEPGHLAEAVVDQRVHDADTGTPDAAIMSVQGHAGDGVSVDLAGMIAEPESPDAAAQEQEPAAISVIELTDVDDAVRLAGEETLLDEEEMHEAVGPVVHDVSVHAGEDAATAGSHADLPVLKQDADPEIVEIFLEEASGVLASISLNIPEWIQQPENTELLEEIRRSLHTLKGSGRMAGAMLMGEFAWSIEALLTKLVEGSIRSGGSLFALLSQVPEAASGLLRQLQDGGEPGMDIFGMMQKAADLASASPAAFSDHAAE